MSLNGGGTTDRRDAASPAAANGVMRTNEASVRQATIMSSSQRLRLNPNKDHKPDVYEGLRLDFSPSIFRSLERYMPPSLLNVPREDKLNFMRHILLKYFPPGEQNRVCFMSVKFLLLSFGM